jgi:sodium pump decarboxylase gamma subunit
MTSNLILSLQITALGMGIVFAAIILLSGMMSLLTRLTAEKEDAPSDESASDSAQAAPIMDREFKAQAAAVAVAIALSELKQIPASQEPPTALVSAWQLGMRTRQMYQKGGRKSS